MFLVILFTEISLFPITDLTLTNQKTENWLKIRPYKMMPQVYDRHLTDTS